MKKQNVLNLIKYHVERNEIAFRNEAIEIAKSFDSVGDYELAEYIMGLITESNLYAPQASDFESDFLKTVDVSTITPLNLPSEITEDIKGIINAVHHNIGINKFLFEGFPGSGKTEAAKHVAKLLDRTLYYVNFDNLIDSKLGQTNKNITTVFSEINKIPYPEKTVILFDEIDVIALDRINNNDVREMGRVTSTILRELDRLTDLNKEIGMIDTNIVALHILTKLFLQDMVEVNRGHIMNVASIAGFMPGPLMATYYSTKAYVVRLTQSIRQELFMKHSKVKISALCPGPVNTNFNKDADVKLNLAEANSKQVAKYAVRKMFANKILIFPSLTMWLGRLLFKIMPDQLSAFFCYFAQKRKIS